MTTKLSALLGVLQGAKKAFKEPFDNAHHDFQRPNLFNGFSKTYRPTDEENGEKFPPEGEIVQRDVEGVLAGVAPLWSRMMDLQASVDRTNQVANGALIIDGVNYVLPSTTLVWLDKTLAELAIVISKAPEVNPTKEWTLDEGTGRYRTATRESIKTMKVPEALVLYPPSGTHPAQVQAYNRDVTIGHWDTTDYSGATLPARKRQMLARVAALRDQIKLALSDANDAEVIDIQVGAALFASILKEN